MLEKTDAVYTAMFAGLKHKANSFNLAIQETERMTKEVEKTKDKFKAWLDVIESSKKLRKTLAITGATLRAMFLIYKFGLYKEIPILLGKTADIIGHAVSAIPRPSATKVVEKNC
jgi:hypothetical protein